MHAAVVHEYGQIPRYEAFPDPVPSGPDELLVDVLAAGLAPRVRSQAAGTHYTERLPLPLVPGVDGVGRGPDGRLRYFLLPDTALGAMAERTLVDERRSVLLPRGADPVTVAAGMNPVMSSWIALRRRTSLRRGQRVMILGATGNAGRLAIQVARRLGAGEVIAVGRGDERVRALGADRAVAFDSPTASADLAAAGAEVDIVLDYVWGQPTADALRAIVPARRREEQELTWIQVGSVAGLESPIPSAALRAVNLRIIGSGQGSVSTRAIKDEIGAIAGELAKGTFAIDARAVPLADVESAWTTPSRERLVLVP